MMKHAKLRNGSTGSSLAKTPLKGGSTLKRGESTLTSRSRLTSEQTKLSVSAKVGSTRLVGDRAEALVDEALSKLGKVEKTKNSGAALGDADMTCRITDTDFLRIEVKKRNTEDFTVDVGVLDNLRTKCLFFDGHPVLTIVNKSDRKLAVMDLQDLIALLMTRK